MGKTKKTMPEADQITKEEKSRGAGRTRNFATVVYPESAPDDWISILEDEKIPALISPLHDKDRNQKAENELKKAHFHVIVMFTSVKTQEQARAVFEKIGGVGCEPVQSIRGYARYLCHLDNPDKVQYSQDNIIALCGADYYGLIELVTDKYKAISEMMNWCVSNSIDELYELIEYARQERMDWFRVLCDSSTLIMREYLRSARFINAKRKADQWRKESNEPA